MPEPKPRHIKPEELAALKAENPAVAVLDVATPERHDRCHIPGAQCACVYEVVFGDNVTRLITDKTTPVVLCGAGVSPFDSAHAAGKLDRLGYSDISILEGGLAAWSQAGLPVEGAAPQEATLQPTAVAVPDGKYAVDPGASRIEWTGRNAGNTHHGTVNLSGGAIEARGGVLSGKFTIDMKSIDCINLKGTADHPVLLRHLASDDFFFAERFPEAVFEIVRAAPLAGVHTSAPNHGVEGLLGLRGLTRPLAFEATFSLPEDGGLAAEAHFDLDRTDWGAIYGCSRFFPFLGMHLVFDPVSIGVRLRAR